MHIQGQESRHVKTNFVGPLPYAEFARLPGWNVHYEFDHDTVPEVH